MKTAISIPDDVFADAERLTQRLKKSRSQLYTEAIREYVARHDADTITEKLNRIYDAGDLPLDPMVAAMSAKVLERTDW
jgi:predicted transcriptional regulator